MPSPSVPRPSRLRPRPVAALVSAAGLLLPLAACAPNPVPASPLSSSAGAALPSAHVHGLAVNSETGQLLLATHDGLFDVTKEPDAKIGATNDLMGFTTDQDRGVFYASGHPGEGSDMPNPLGLIRSTDGGKTWEQLSRQGVSDFHTLALTKSGIVAFDGTLRASRDGKSWQTVTAGFVPAVLAGNPASDTVLATTQEGIQRSTDGGTTWSLATTAPVIQFAAFAGPAEAVGVEPDGSVHVSLDAGMTWVPKGSISGEVHAIVAAPGTDGAPRVWAATADGVMVSTDGGTTFRAMGAP